MLLSPTNFSDDSDALDFYNTLSELIKKLPGHNLKSYVVIFECTNQSLRL